MMEGKFITLPGFIRSLQERITQNYVHRKISLRIGDFSRIPDCYFNHLQLEMVFWHLLDNAIKFNDKPVPHIKIQGKVSKKGKIEISLSDNGPGIPPENHDLIFSQFYQYERFYTGNVEGLGLGLSMVKKILEDWGQRITMDSELGKGTTFRFTLPSHESG
jgi:signal transduction histidine kinase